MGKVKQYIEKSYLIDRGSKEQKRKARIFPAFRSILLSDCPHYLALVSQYKQR